MKNDIVNTPIREMNLQSDTGALIHILFLEGGERRYVEEQWQEDPGFECIFVTNAQLPLTLSRGKKEKILQEEKREFGWSCRRHLQYFHLHLYFSLFLVKIWQTWHKGLKGF